MPGHERFIKNMLAGAGGVDPVSYTHLGHMGREDLGVAWEKTDRVDALLAAVK